MTFDPLINAGGVIPLHAYAAMLSLVIGGAQFAMPKGTQLHRMMGRIWVMLMAAVAVSSFFIWEIRLIWLFSPIHLLSIITLIGLFEAVRAARQGRIADHQRGMKIMYFFALIVAGLFTFLPGRIMHQVLFGA